MTQPSFVHLRESDSVRPSTRLGVPRNWVQDRVAELKRPGQPKGNYLGVQGPDQGYALHLAEGFSGQVNSSGSATVHDAIAGCLQVALARASRFGRAPCKADVEFALTLFGFLGDAPESLVKTRDDWFSGCDHDYWAQRAIADLVPGETLGLTVSQVRDRLEDWTELFSAA